MTKDSCEEMLVKLDFLIREATMQYKEECADLTMSADLVRSRLEENLANIGLYIKEYLKK